MNQQTTVNHDEIQAIPKTIAAYLEQATLAIAKESHFEPENEEVMKRWVEGNFPTIIQRAIEMQRTTFEKVVSDTPVGQALRKVLCTQVWCEIKTEEVKQMTQRQMNHTVRSIFHDEDDLHSLMFGQ